MSLDAIPATAVEDKATLALQDKLDRSLAKTKPSKRELTLQYFSDLYPRLEAHLALGKSLKDVLVAFNDVTHLKVCARTFNEMLKQQRSNNTNGGDAPGCRTCGKPLSPSDFQSGSSAVAVEAETEEVVDA